MGLYRGTIYGEAHDGDKMEFTAIMRLSLAAHYPEEVRVQIAMREFKARYYEAVEEALSNEPVVLWCDCEELSDRADDAVNR